MPDLRRQPVKFREITSERTGEASAQIRERVVAARRRQHERFQDRPKITCNARVLSENSRFRLELTKIRLTMEVYIPPPLNFWPNCNPTPTLPG